MGAFQYCYFGNQYPHTFKFQFDQVVNIHGDLLEKTF